MGKGYAACKHVALLDSFISSKSANKVRFNYVRLNGACRQKKAMKSKWRRCKGRQ